MSRDRHSHALLFEIVIVLFFFALSSTVILNVFLKTHDLSVRGRMMNRALYIAEDLAETLYCEGDPAAYLNAAGFVLADEVYRCTTEEQMQLAVRLSANETEAGHLMDALVTVSSGEEAIVELPAIWYVPDVAEGTA